MVRTTRWLAAALAVVMSASLAGHGGMAPQARAAERVLMLASTTSTDNSGLFGHLLPAFTDATGIEVRVIAVGTGQALRLGERGDVDAVLTHDPAAEAAFVAAGHGLARVEVMVNDFVIAGPRQDPAGIGGLPSAAAALAAIADAGAAFVSRSDDSGTHRREMQIWDEAGLDPKAASGTWYRETGGGMGAALNIAAALPAYILTDRGTWISFKNRRDLELLLEGDPSLENRYAAMVVNPDRHPHIALAEARAFVDWLRSPEGQQRIADFRIEGQQLFRPVGG